MILCSPCSFLQIILFLTTVSLVTLLAFFILIQIWLRRIHNRAHWDPTAQHMTKSIGFFHPYCNAGGGGELVLWCAIKAVQTKYPEHRCIVYTGDKNVSAEDILKNTKKNFNITLPKPVEFIFLSSRYLIEDKKYQYFTLLGQSIGSILLSVEAIFKFVPNVYIDTMGYAFTFPVFKYFGNCKIGCYVHYPTISVDMLSKVSQRQSDFNNPDYIVKNPFLSKVKIVYYHVFAKLYSVCGRCADIVMVNSSWTEGHINSLWKKLGVTYRIYPPCNVAVFEKLQLKSINEKDHIILLSVAQFRPEKNHELQIRAFEDLQDLLDSEKRERVHLIIIGSCRNDEDKQRVKDLEELVHTLHLEKHITFEVNISFQTLKDHLEKALIGLHTMQNEHFGIGVVECMAAGLITIAHNSGGPKMDIITEYDCKPTGFLANSAKEYAEKMAYIINLSPEEIFELQTNARLSVQRFSENKFASSFIHAIEPLLKT